MQNAPHCVTIFPADDPRPLKNTPLKTAFLTSSLSPYIQFVTAVFVPPAAPPNTAFRMIEALAHCMARAPVVMFVTNSPKRTSSPLLICPAGPSCHYRALHARHAHIDTRRAQTASDGWIFSRIRGGKCPREHSGVILERDTSDGKTWIFSFRQHQFRRRTLRWPHISVGFESIAQSPLTLALAVPF